MLQPISATATAITQQLDAVTANVFASMMELGCEPVGPPVPEAETICARVQFLGALTGCCLVALNHAGAIALVRAMLHMDVDAGDALGDDAVRELCNMIAGGWKSGLPPNVSASSMTPPMACGERSAMGPATVARLYRFAGNLLEVELRLPTM